MGDLVPQAQIVLLIRAALLPHHPAGFEDVWQVATEALEGEVSPLLDAEGFARLHQGDVRHRSVVVHGEVRWAGIAGRVHVGGRQLLGDREQARVAREVVEAGRGLESIAVLPLRPAHRTANSIAHGRTRVREEPVALNEDAYGRLGVIEREGHDPGEGVEPQGPGGVAGLVSGPALAIEYDALPVELDDPLQRHLRHIESAVGGDVVTIAAGARHVDRVGRLRLHGWCHQKRGGEGPAHEQRPHHAHHSILPESGA